MCDGMTSVRHNNNYALYPDWYTTYFFGICWNSCTRKVFIRQEVVPCSTGGGCCYGNLKINRNNDGEISIIWFLYDYYERVTQLS